LKHHFILNGSPGLRAGKAQCGKIIYLYLF